MNLLIVRDKKLVKAMAVAGVAAAAPAGQADKTLWKRFDAHLSLEAPESKSFKVIEAGGVITDYQDVTIKGYLSTFAGYTEMDRQGDYVVNGAFADTLKKFMLNPVMLRDHVNSTTHLVGNFVVMREDQKGLYFEARLSNAPDVRDVRFKVAEGMLKTCSMGGLWHYKEDGRGIFRADLWEGSITPIPANPDAIFSTRSLNKEDVKFLKAMGRDDIITRLGLTS